MKKQYSDDERRGVSILVAWGFNGKCCVMPAGVESGKYQSGPEKPAIESQMAGQLSQHSLRRQIQILSHERATFVS